MSWDTSHFLPLLGGRGAFLVSPPLFVHRQLHSLQVACNSRSGFRPHFGCSRMTYHLAPWQVGLLKGLLNSLPSSCAACCGRMGQPSACCKARALVWSFSTWPRWSWSWRGSLSPVAHLWLFLGWSTSATRPSFISLHLLIHFFSLLFKWLQLLFCIFHVFFMFSLILPFPHLITVCHFSIYSCSCFSHYVLYL